MRKLIPALAMLVLLACNAGPKKANYEQMLERSLRVKDYQTAITAIHMLLLNDSTERKYLDSLPELYAAVRNYEATEFYTDLALKNQPNSESLMQLKALCLENKGDYEGTMDMFSKLYTTTKKLPYLYQLTAIQLESGDMESSKKGLKVLEDNIATSKDSVDFMLSATEKQKVPIRAAVYHLKAYNYAQNRDLMNSKKFFEMAIKEYPQFMAARQAYSQLMQGARQ